MDSEFLKKIRSIELTARKLAKEGLAGQYQSTFRGSGMQFKEFRPYVFGDDVRHISWNVSARTEDPILKVFEEERERTLFLVVDISGSLRRGPWAQAKSERLALVAGSLAMSASETKDKLGLLLFSDQVELVVPPAKGRNHVMRIIRELLSFPAKSRKTDPDRALQKLDHVLRRHSIVVFCSDMEKLPSEKLLRQTASRHELLAISVFSQAETEVPPIGFLELETAERLRPATLDTKDTRVREHLKDHFAMQRQHQKIFFEKNGVDYLGLSTEGDWFRDMQNFLSQRRKRRGVRT